MISLVMISNIKIAAQQSHIKLGGGRIQLGMLGVAVPYDSQSCCVLCGFLRSKCTMFHNFSVDICR